MIHSVVSKGAQDENYNKNLYEVQNSNKKRPAGLSLMLFKNTTEMDKHVGQVTEMSPVRERNHNWPEERRSITYIKKLITRPGDTFSSRAKDLQGKGAFFCNPVLGKRTLFNREEGHCHHRVRRPSSAKPKCHYYNPPRTITPKLVQRPAKIFKPPPEPPKVKIPKEP